MWHTAGGGQLEGPQEVGRLLEAGAHSHDLVNEVLNADDTKLAQSLHANYTSCQHSLDDTAAPSY